MSILNLNLLKSAAVAAGLVASAAAGHAADEPQWKTETRIGADGKPFTVKVLVVPAKAYPTYTPAPVYNDPVGVFAVAESTDHSQGWYLPGFGYVPPWPHTLPRVKASERYMGYLVPSRGGYGIPNNAPPGGWNVPVVVTPATQWYWVPRHLESPFLDAIAAGRLRWTYPPNWRPPQAPAGQQAQYPVIAPAVPTETLPSPFPEIPPAARPAVPAELSKRDVAALRGEAASLLKANRADRALPLLTAATERDADDAAAWSLRAVAELEVGNVEAATDSARRAQALELMGQADAATVAKALETVQGPARQFLKLSGEKMTLADAHALLAKPAVTGLVAK